jgi:TonB-dependent receptor
MGVLNPANGRSSRDVTAAVRAALGSANAAMTASAFALAMVLSTGAHAQTQKPQASQKSDGLEEVVVTARRQAIQNADERKKNSETIIDSVLADDAGKLPDNSITEVLQRVPGVTITRWGDPDHFNAEGTGVQIRGLSGVAGRVNGREVISANGGHGLSWSDVTPELMAGVDVYKSSTADLIEGGTAGQIDLRTKMPFDYDGFAAQVSGNGEYGDFRKKSSPTVSALVSNTWDTGIGRIGVLVDLAYGEYASRSDYFAIEPYYKTRVGTEDRYIPGGFDYGTGEYDRTRKGAYAALQWQVSDNLEIDQTYWQSRYEQENAGQGVFMVTKTLSVDPNGNNVFDASGGLISSDSLYLYSPTNLGTPTGTFGAGGDTGIGHRDSDTRDISTSFKLNSESGRWALRGAFQAVDSESNSFSYDVFPTIPFAASGFGMDLSGEFPVITMPPATQVNLQDPSQYTYNATMDHLEKNVAKMRSFNLDLDYALSDEGFFRSLQVGARYSDRSETDKSSGYNWTALGVGWNGYQPVSFANGHVGDYQAAVFDNFFRGKAGLPGNVLLPSVSMARRADVLGDHAFYGNPLAHGIQYQPWESADFDMTNTAAYGLIRFADDTGIFGIPYKGNFGARVVRVEHDSKGFYHQAGRAYADPTTGALITLKEFFEPLAGGRTDTRVLPSLNLQFSPSEAVKVRFAYNDTMDLPSVNELKANGSLDISFVTNTNNQNTTTPREWSVQFGNPQLKPVISHNSDISVEWYAKPGTTAHFDLFHKELDNWLVYTNSTQPFPVVYADGTEVLLPVNFNGIGNSEKTAKITGAEVGVRTYLDMLPGALAGLGFEANYTYIDSKNPGDVYYDINGGAHNDAPVKGLSKNAYNLALLYDYEIWSARLAYNWRSEYLLSVAAHGSDGDYNFITANTPASTNCALPTATTCEFIDISLPVYSDSYGQLDFGMTLRPSDHWYASLQVANLTNTVVKSKFGGYPAGKYNRNWFTSDRQLNLGVGYKF